MFWSPTTLLLFFFFTTFLVHSIQNAQWQWHWEEMMKTTETVPIISHLCHSFLWHFCVLSSLSSKGHNWEAMISFSGICVVLDCMVRVEQKFENKYKPMVFREAFHWRWQGKLLQDRATETRNCGNSQASKYKVLTCKSVIYRCYHQAVESRNLQEKWSRTVCNKVYE